MHGSLNVKKKKTVMLRLMSVLPIHVSDTQLEFNICGSEHHAL